MRIGIDATHLTIPFPCGTKNYVRNLINNLAKIDSKNQYFIFASKNISIPCKSNFTFVKTPRILPFLKRQFFLSYYAKSANLDVFHYLQPYGDVFLKHPAIITTVHDINLNETYPYFSSYFVNRIICEITRHFVFKNTKVFISISNATRKELSAHLQSKYRKPIKTIYEAANENFLIPKKLPNFRKYYLAMGDFAPRKNIFSIIIAYSLLPQAIRNKYPLKIVASTESSAKRFRIYIIKTGMNSQVDVLTKISDKKLIDCYKNALAFVYPSLYEGFGLPLLEAMTQKCPVITSNYGAMKEVTGDAAIFVDPKSPLSIEKAMLKIAQDDKLRISLVSKGLKRVKQFSWKKTARETLKIYENV
jgi:glycosyltransferase involved in cell wall biosynthesis